MAYALSACRDFVVQKNLAFQDLLYRFIHHPFVLSKTKERDIRVSPKELFASFNIIPHAIKWFCRAVLFHQIESFSLKATSEKTTKVATLYFHSKTETLRGDHVAPILVVHGDYGHPLNFLNLIDIAVGKNRNPVFSLFMPTEDDDYSEESRSLFRQAIDKIVDLVDEQHGIAGGFFDGIKIVGVSKGAIQGAYSLFVERDHRIQSLFSICGRLNDVDDPDRECTGPLKGIVKRIYAAIQANPQIPLTVVHGDRDWCVAPAMMAVRPGQDCHVVKDALHGDVLYRPESERLLSEWLERA